MLTYSLPWSQSSRSLSSPSLPVPRFLSFTSSIRMYDPPKYEPGYIFLRFQISCQSGFMVLQVSIPKRRHLGTTTTRLGRDVLRQYCPIFG